MMDLTGLFRVWNPQYKSWSVFGQDHLAKLLLNWDTSAGGHDAGARVCVQYMHSRASQALLLPLLGSCPARLPPQLCAVASAGC